MNLNSLQNTSPVLVRLGRKKICILGLGIENYALVKFLLKKNAQCDITVCDARPSVNKELPLPKKIKRQLGKGYDKNLKQYDIIFRIAGYPLFTKQIIKAMMAGVEISSPTKLFFDLCPTKNIIGVTGTKGKGTTASLIYHILKTAGKQVHLAGNIGVPMFGFMDKIRKNDWVVLELSSFQLEDLPTSPRIAVFTNFFAEHLAPVDPNNPNYHKSLKTYWDAKENIFAHQSAKDILIANNTLRDKIRLAKPKGKVIYFTASKLDTPLLGEHNRKNIAAAVLATQKAGVKIADIKKNVKNFRGLEHRLEFVGEKNKIRYYNDSFATAPDATITALRAFTPKTIVLIAGGADKGSDFTTLAKEIKKRVRCVILLPGKGSRRIKQTLLKLKIAKIQNAKNMKQAVRLGKQNTSSGDVVLLSPACASFGIFKNYKERGNLFKKEIKK